MEDDGSVAEFSDFWEVSSVYIIGFVVYFIASTLLLKFVVKWQLFRIISYMRKMHTSGHCLIQLVSSLFIMFIALIPILLALVWGY